MSERKPYEELKHEKFKKDIKDAYEAAKPRAHIDGWEAVFTVVHNYAQMKMHDFELPGRGFENLGTAETCDDYAQKATIAVIENLDLGKFEGETSDKFFSYVAGTIHRKKVDFFRYLKREKNKKVSLVVTNRESGDETDNPALYSSNGGYDIPRMPLPEGLSSHERFIYHLRFTEGRSIELIALEYDKSVVAVRSELKRVIAKVKKLRAAENAAKAARKEQQAAKDLEMAARKARERAQMKTAYQRAAEERETV